MKKRIELYEQQANGVIVPASIVAAPGTVLSELIPKTPRKDRNCQKSQRAPSSPTCGNYDLSLARAQDSLIHSKGFSPNQGTYRKITNDSIKLPNQAKKPLRTTPSVRNTNRTITKDSKPRNQAKKPLGTHITSLVRNAKKTEKRRNLVKLGKSKTDKSKTGYYDFVKAKKDYVANELFPEINNCNQLRPPHYTTETYSTDPFKDITLKQKDFDLKHGPCKYKWFTTSNTGKMEISDVMAVDRDGYKLVPKWTDKVKAEEIKFKFQNKVQVPKWTDKVKAEASATDTGTTR